MLKCHTNILALKNLVGHHINLIETKVPHLNNIILQFVMYFLLNSFTSIFLCVKCNKKFNKGNLATHLLQITIFTISYYLLGIQISIIIDIVLSVVLRFTASDSLWYLLFFLCNIVYYHQIEKIYPGNRLTCMYTMIHS